MKKATPLEKLSISQREEIYRYFKAFQDHPQFDGPAFTLTAKHFGVSRYTVLEIKREFEVEASRPEGV